MQIEILSSHELYHYGVLGMKWGVRKDNKARGKYYRTGRESKDINKSGSLYVSSSKKDAARYAKYFGPSIFNKIFAYNNATHVQTLSSSKKLKEASKKETIKGLLKGFSEDDELLSAYNKSFERLAISDKQITKEHINKILKTPSSNEAKTMAYGFSMILGNSKYSKYVSKIYDSFRKEGYDAIPDLFDRNNGSSKTASIVIRPDKLKTISSLELDKETYKKVKKYFKTLEKIPISEIAKHQLQL